MKRPSNSQARVCRASLSAILLSAWAVVAATQESLRANLQPAGAFDGQFRVSANLILVPVSVTDSSGRPVPGLDAADFLVEEDGRLQAIARITDPGRAALDLALLLDTSGSMTPRFRFAQQAAAAFIRTMVRDDDTISLWSIGPVPSLKVGRTCDVDAAVSALMALRGAEGTTALYDTAAAAASSLERPSRPGSVRVLVVLSDGEDNNSVRHGLPGAAGELQRTECLLYAINSAGSSAGVNETGRRGLRALHALASDTGGLAFSPERPEDLPAVFDRIAGDLHAQYLLEYYAREAPEPERFRQVRVRVPGRPDLRVRSRRGYWPHGL